MVNFENFLFLFECLFLLFKFITYLVGLHLNNAGISYAIIASFVSQLRL